MWDPTPKLAYSAPAPKRDPKAPRITNHSKTKVRSATLDATTGRPISRFKRRKLEASPEYREKFNAGQKELLKARRQRSDAAAVTADAKQRLKDAARGE